MIDLIERQKAIDAVRRTAYHDLIKENMVLLLMDLPSAEPERKKGRWERHNTYHGDDTSGYIDPDWRCSVCGRQANVNEWFMYDLTDFCPNCGAKMEAGHE